MDRERKILERKLNIEYGAIHGAYWMYYGVICSFSSVFLLGKGFPNWKIGIILSLGNIIAVLVQPFIANFADRTKRMSIFSIMETMTLVLLGFTALLMVMRKGSLGLAAVYVMSFALMMIIQPFCNALCFKLEDAGVSVNFGAARSVGSLTYAVLVLILGAFIDRRGVNVLPVTGIAVLLLFIATLVVLGKGFQGCNATGNAAIKEEEDIKLIEFIKRNRIFFLINLGVLGVYFANSILNTYMAQIVRAVGGNNEDLGRIFSLLAFMEIPTLVLFNRIHKRFSCSTLLKFSSAAFVAWIGMCTIARNVTVLLLAQFIQPFSFALFLPAMVHYIDENLSDKEAIRGHSLFTATTAVGAIFAGFLGGIVLDVNGTFALTLMGTCVNIAGAVIIFLTVDKAKK